MFLEICLQFQAAATILRTGSSLPSSCFCLLPIDVLQDTIERERQRIMAAFAFLREFLEKEEGHQLTQMGKMDREVAKQRNEIIDRLLEEMASLENTIQKLEAKCENPPGDLLKVRCNRTSD